MSAAALIMPLSPAVLPALFGPDERGKAVGMISAASGGMPLGPLVGGLLLGLVLRERRSPRPMLDMSDGRGQGRPWSGSGRAWWSPRVWW
ncbi:hypothetical protein GTY41_05165 [Streptomyces sp. SID685]|uniref:MFS transporter n=1 Tax=Streptomyces griseofuscus TaxID=146922 RepID=UPI0013681CBE|nr:hypothetical protein [Streptomyces sp. SID685]